MPDFSPLLKALETCRWVVAEGIAASDAAALFQQLRGADASSEWILVDEVAQGDLRYQWKAGAPRTVVVDALHLTESARLCASAKHLLKAFPDTRYVFLTEATGLELPSYYGLGQTFYGEDLASLDQVGRADAELLRHARKLIPAYGIKDLVLGPITQLKFHEALSYVRTRSHCEDNWGFRERHSRGHGITVLFHGPSGTGKTMAAEVMAAELNLPLYQVDLSALVSKWVGETEKNLRAIFKAAEGVKGILLFDEGDALFGNRTEVKNSGDRYGNMEVNYLLQEVERFNGVAVLSTNHFNNMDPAFLRRFTYTIVFGPPVAAQRLKIWQRNIPDKMPVAADVQFKHLGEFVLTGGSIKNCIRQAAARAAGRNDTEVHHEDFLWAIKRELQKHDIDLSREMVGEEYWRRVAPEWEFRQTQKT